jgi:hypothetical protein
MMLFLVGWVELLIESEMKRGHIPALNDAEFSLMNAHFIAGRVIYGFPFEPVALDHELVPVV